MISILSREKLKTFSDFDNHEQVLRIENRKTGLLSFIAIHDTTLGPAVGGTRMYPYKTEKKAITDVLKLSRAMSYKCALAGVPYGGGKAVIIGDPKKKTEGLLKSYGLYIQKLKGKLRTGTDIGITDKDVSVMATQTKYMIGVLYNGQKLSTSDMAALGTYYSILACLEHRFGKKSPKGRTVAIKGLGKLGGRLAELLSLGGAKIIGADIDKDIVEQIKRRVPTLEVVNFRGIHKLKCDVYAPCALGDEFNKNNVGVLKAKIICGGANNQLSDKEVGVILHSRRILYAPDYIANSGGLINVIDEMERGGYRQARVLRRVKEIGKILEKIFNLSEQQNRPPSEEADILAQQIIDGKKANMLDVLAEKYLNILGSANN